MAADSGAQVAAGKRSGRAMVFKAVRVLGIGVLVALVVLALLIAFPPQSLVVGRLTKIASAATGRDIAIGSARLVLRKDLEVSLADVTLPNPAGMSGPALFKAETVKARVKLWPLLHGQTEIESVDLVRPEINLHEDPEGKKNWVIASKSAAPEKTGLVLPKTMQLGKARLSYVSDRTGAKASADNVDATVTSDPATGAADAKGTLAFKGEPVGFDIAVADARLIADGKPTGLKATIDGRHGKANINGSTTIGDPVEISGDVIASSPSAMALARWLGADVASGGDAINTSIKGKIRATSTDVSFAETDVMVNGTPSRLDGKLGLRGPRPKLEGTIAAPRIDLGKLIGTPPPQRAAARALALAPSEEPVVDAPWSALANALDALDKPDAGTRSLGAAPSAEAQAAAKAINKGPWSQEPFDFTRLRGVDLDVTVTADEVAYKTLDLKKGRVKAGLTDGRLAAKLEQLNVGQGNATGTIDLDSRANPPRAAIALNLTDVAAEPIIKELSGKPLLSGTSSVEIKANASGQTQDQLASTLEGKARFRMAKGALRGFDIRRMISEWWKSWHFDLGNKTNFERLEAQYDIKKGIMKSSPGLDIDGSEVAINSKGEINVPSRRLNQEIRVKVIPPPTALPIPVRISGDWAKPAVSIDWNGLFSSAGGLGGPQAVAPSAEPMPVEVREKIERVLATDVDSSRLSDGGRAMLRSLLPQER